jgi:hypothetical protein
MNLQAQRTVTRENVLGLLSDEENARVSTGESGPLTPGEEYIDLTRLEAGVTHAGSMASATGQMLRKSSVREATWAAVLREIAKPPVTETGAAPTGAKQAVR